jgi:hypothetical protein
MAASGESAPTTIQGKADHAMRLELETDDILICMTVPGPYSPDIGLDVANRVLDVFHRSLPLIHPDEKHDTSG